MKKEIAEFIHAKRRASERYQIRFDAHLQGRIIEIIRTQKARFIKRQSRRVTIWEVELVLKDDWINGDKPQKFRVVHDSKRNQIVTFLPIK